MRCGGGGRAQNGGCHSVLPRHAAHSPMVWPFGGGGGGQRAAKDECVCVHAASPPACCVALHPPTTTCTPTTAPQCQRGRLEPAALRVRAGVHLPSPDTAAGRECKGGWCGGAQHRASRSLVAAACARPLRHHRGRPAADGCLLNCACTGAPVPQEPTPNTCVTVCGTSGECVHAAALPPHTSPLPCSSDPPMRALHGVRAALDACTDACQRTACANTHHVPAWNETCMQRCTQECMKLQSKRQ